MHYVVAARPYVISQLFSPGVDATSRGEVTLWEMKKIMSSGRIIYVAMLYVGSRLQQHLGSIV